MSEVLLPAAISPSSLLRREFGSSAARDSVLAFLTPTWLCGLTVDPYRHSSGLGSFLLARGTYCCSRGRTVRSNSATHPERLKRRTLWHPLSRRPGGRGR